MVTSSSGKLQENYCSSYLPKMKRDLNSSLEAGCCFI